MRRARCNSLTHGTHLYTVVVEGAEVSVSELRPLRTSAARPFEVAFKVLLDRLGAVQLDAATLTGCNVGRLASGIIYARAS